jgi:hypothetical protein
MTTFISILGWILAIIWFFAAIFVYACAKDEKKNQDGSWKLFFIAAAFLLVTAVYCGVSACILP